MKTVGVYEARTHWSRIIREVEAGEVYIITRRGKPVARLVGIHQQPHEAAGEGLDA